MSGDDACSLAPSALPQTGSGRGAGALYGSSSDSEEFRLSVLAGVSVAWFKDCAVNSDDASTEEWLWIGALHCLRWCLMADRATKSTTRKTTRRHPTEMPAMTPGEKSRRSTNRTITTTPDFHLI